MSSFLSKRGEILANHSDFLGRCFMEYLADPYKADDNPSGIVCLGTADNILSDDLLLEKINRKENLWFEPWMLHYYSYHGVPSLLSAIAKFVQHFFKPLKPIKEENVLGFLGTCSIFDVVGHLVAEPNEVGFLIYNVTYGESQFFLLMRYHVSIGITCSP